MNSYAICFFSISIFLAAPLAAMSPPVPANQKIASHKTLAVLWYQRSAEMCALYYQAYNVAKSQLHKKIKTAGKGKKAVVLDIDETILDNSPYEARRILTGTVYDSRTWREWTALARAAALPGALNFCRYAVSLGVEVFYISNRSVKERDVTLKNMKDLGFPFADVSHVLLRRRSGDKTARRQKVLAGFNVLLWIGDNLGDFDARYDKRGPDGGKAKVDGDRVKFGTDFIILPNPMYGTWLKAVYGGTYRLKKNEQAKKHLSGLKQY